MAAPPAVTPNKRGVRSRELVLDAAESIMAEQGYDAASLNSVVERSGVPISSVYHYFGSKDGVLLAVMERGAERFFAALTPRTERQGTPEEHLKAVLDDTLRVLVAQPDFLRLLVAMAVQPPTGQAQQAAGEVVGGVRERALDALRLQMHLAFGIRRTSKQADGLARFALAAIDGAFVASSADGKPMKGLLAGLPVALVALAGR